MNVLSSYCNMNDTATPETYTYLHTLSQHDARPIAISAATGSANPRRRIWPSARERQSAMLIVTGTDETRQGSVGAQRRSSSGPAGRRQLLPQLALSPHFDYILIELLENDTYVRPDKPRVWKQCVSQGIYSVEQYP